MRKLLIPGMAVAGCLVLSSACGGSNKGHRVVPEAGVGDLSGGSIGTEGGTETAGPTAEAGGAASEDTSTAATDGKGAGVDDGSALGDGAIDRPSSLDLGTDGARDLLELDQAAGSSCAGKPDFTPCTLATAPDRRYDICISEHCVSPGCGDKSCNTPGPHFSLADTGQRTCASSSAAITCPSSGAPFFGQDAQYGWDTQHAASERFTRTAAAEPVVTDTATGLIWQGCAAGLAGSDCATGTAALQTWQDALATCDALSWGGSQDWRLPDLYELDSIDIASTTLDATAFPAALQSGKSYWSSSTVAEHSGLAWTNYRGAGLDKTYTELVRCVRGGSPLAGPRFAKDTSSANQPTVLDHLTGLTWQGCVGPSSGADCSVGVPDVSPWSDALATCESLSWAGHSDWRMPNWKELRSLVDSRQASPAIDKALFPGTPFDRFTWTSTSDRCSGSTCYAWAVSFSDGQVTMGSPKSSAGYVRCVRGGP